MPTLIEWTGFESDSERLATITRSDTVVHARACCEADGWYLRVGGEKRAGPFDEVASLHAWMIDNVQGLIEESSNKLRET